MSGEEYLSYPVTLHWVTEETDPGCAESYVFAYYPDFGHSACSAVGDTAAEALDNLQQVLGDVVDHYRATGRPIPEPSPHPVVQEYHSVRYWVLVREDDAAAAPTACKREGRAIVRVISTGHYSERIEFVHPRVIEVGAGESFVLDWRAISRLLTKAPNDAQANKDEA